MAPGGKQGSVTAQGKASGQQPRRDAKPSGKKAPSPLLCNRSPTAGNSKVVSGLAQEHTVLGSVYLSRRENPIPSCQDAPRAQLCCALAPCSPAAQSPREHPVTPGPYVLAPGHLQSGEGPRELLGESYILLPKPCHLQCFLCP